MFSPVCLHDKICSPCIKHRTNNKKSESRVATAMMLTTLLDCLLWSQRILLDVVNAMEIGHEFENFGHFSVFSKGFLEVTSVQVAHPIVFSSFGCQFNRLFN